MAEDHTLVEVVAAGEQVAGDGEGPAGGARTPRMGEDITLAAPGAANHLRDLFVRTLSQPAPGPRAVRIRLWEGAEAVGEPQAEAEWSRE